MKALLLQIGASVIKIWGSVIITNRGSFAINWGKVVQMGFVTIDLFTDSDAILKILSVDFCGKVKVNSDSSSKIV